MEKSGDLAMSLFMNSAAGMPEGTVRRFMEAGKEGEDLLSEVMRIAASEITDEQRRAYESELEAARNSHRYKNRLNIIAAQKAAMQFPLETDWDGLVDENAPEGQKYTHLIDLQVGVLAAETFNNKGDITNPEKFEQKLWQQWDDFIDEPESKPTASLSTNPQEPSGEDEASKSQTQGGGGETTPPTEPPTTVGPDEEEPEDESGEETNNNAGPKEANRIKRLKGKIASELNQWMKDKEEVEKESVLGKLARMYEEMKKKPMRGATEDEKNARINTAFREIINQLNKHGSDVDKIEWEEFTDLVAAREEATRIREERAAIIKDLDINTLHKVRDGIALSLIKPEEGFSLKTALGDDLFNRLPNNGVGESNQAETLIDWFLDVDKALMDKEVSGARRGMTKNMMEASAKLFETEGRAGVEAYLKTLQAHLAHAYFLGEFSEDLWRVIPTGVTLREFKHDLEAVADHFKVALNGKEDRDQARKDLLEIIEAERMAPAPEGAERASMFPFMDARSIEQYLFLDEYRKIIQEARTLTPQERLRWGARIFGTMLRGGGGSGMAQFYARALEGDEDAPPVESALKAGIQWILKTEQLKGYKKREHIHEAFGFFTPEELSALIQVEVPIKVLLEGEETPRAFNLSGKDLLGVFYNQEALSRLKANKGLGADSHAFWKGEYLKQVIYRKMGFSEDLIQQWEAQHRYIEWHKEGLTHEQISEKLGPRASKALGYKALSSVSTLSEEAIKAHFGSIDQVLIDDASSLVGEPKIVRSNLVSFANQLEQNNLGLLMGENWWMLMAAYNEINWTRADYKLLPIEEVRRREMLAERDNVGDYRRLYGIVSPEYQGVNEIALLPDYFSLAADSALVKPLVELVNDQTNFAPGADVDKIGKARKEIIERTAKIEVVSPIALKTLSALAMGRQGVGANGVDAFIQNLNQEMSAIETLRRTAVRNFGNWQNAHIGKIEWGKVGVDGQMVPNVVDYTSTLQEQIWEGFNARTALERCGLSDLQIEKIPQDELVGLKGWQTVLKHANAHLMQLDQAAYKDIDSSNRYAVVVHGAVDQIMKMSKIGMEGLERKHDIETPLSPNVQRLVNRQTHDMAQSGSDREPFAHEILDAMPATRSGFQKMVMKAAEELNLGGFGTNETAAATAEMLVGIWANENLGWRILPGNDERVLVLDIDEKTVAAGENFSTKRITRNEHRIRWAEILGIEIYDEKPDGNKELKSGWVGIVENNHDYKRVVQALRSHEMVFVGSAEMSEGDHALVGPNLGYIPNTTTPRELLGRLHATALAQVSSLSKREGTRKSKVRGKWEDFAGRVQDMLDKGFFSWNYLRDGGMTVSPLDVTGTVLPSIGAGGRISPMGQAQIHADMRAMEEAGLIETRTIMGDYAFSQDVRSLPGRWYQLSKQQAGPMDKGKAEKWDHGRKKWVEMK